MRPVIGITMGDPAGIGPEITAKLFQDPDIFESCRPFVVGDVSMMKEGIRTAGGGLEVHVIQKPEEGYYRPGIIDVMDLGLVDLKTLKIGEVSAQAGEAAFQYVKKVIDLAMEGAVDATVTNALNKEAISGGPSFFRAYGNIRPLYQYQPLHDDAGTPESPGGSRFHPCISAGGLRPGEKGKSVGSDPHRLAGSEANGN